MRRIGARVIAGVLVALAAVPAAVAAPRRETDYARAVATVEAFVAREVADKGLPALSIALVDDRRVVWAKGFGYADPARQVRATADTVYRVGSVSKLFTDLAIMRLVERGKVDLDAPVTTYLPDFRPKNPFDAAPITLRMLMSHRSGLAREPPVGNSFDASSPSLAATVESLNRTELVYAPGSRTKYSNAGIAAVGLALERVEGSPFATALARDVLAPLGMRRSAFAPTPALKRDLAKGTMWTLDGRTFDAPTFELGIAPAGCMVTTVTDLGRFLSALFAGGGGVVRPETLAAMWTPQFAPAGAKAGYGLGFRVSELDGHRRVGHGGAIYGFATELQALPDDRLGVVVATSLDVANGVAARICELALRAMLAARRGETVAAPDATAPVNPALARRLVGRYMNGDDGVEIEESLAGPAMTSLRGGGGPGFLRAAKNGALVGDSRLGYGPPVEARENAVVVDGTAFTRVEDERPPPVATALAGLVGEYGPDYDVLYVFERGGQLWTLVEWFELDPLDRVSDDVYAFPSTSSYQGERLVFSRDARGRATEVAAASVLFKRRQIGPEEGATQLRVRPVRPVPELLREALGAHPPDERGDFLPSDLVEVAAVDPTIHLDVRYAGTNNFLGTPFYSQARAFMQRPAAEALARVSRALEPLGYGLLVHDAYRPWYVTKVFWEATPDAEKIFVADPAKGSRHNRGEAVDLTLYDLATGAPVEMVGTYDETSDRSYPDYPGGTSLERWHRALLRRAMEAEGFTVYEAEWWHFDYKDWKRYRIGNERFEAIGR